MERKYINLMKKLSKSFAGKYVAVDGDIFLASGKSQLDAYKKAKPLLDKAKNPGIFYIPAKDLPPLLLKIR